MAKRSERLDREFRYVLRRCPMLTDAECRLLAIVGSYEKGCLLKYDDICALTGFKSQKPTMWSRSKLKRTIHSLVKYGLIEKSHGCYKRVQFKIAPAAVQFDFAHNNGSSVSHGSRSTHEPIMAHQQPQDGSRVSHSILEKELERNEEKNDLSKFTMTESDLKNLIAKKFGHQRSNEGMHDSKVNSDNSC